MTRRCRAVGHRGALHALAVLGSAAVLALTVAACGNDSSSSTTPTVPRTTDSFNGTVPVGGSDFHSFPVQAAGNTDVTLTAAGPPPNVIMGLAIGTVSDAGCTRLTGASVNTAAGPTPQLSGLTSTGTLCVQVRDVGNQTAPVTYSVSVTHP